MSESSPTYDLVEWCRQFREAWNRKDFDAIANFYAADAEFTSHGIGAFEGRSAIRAFIEDWHAPFERFAMELEEILDLGSEVSFAVVVLNGNYAGSSSEVRLRYASVSTYADGLIAKIRNYTDIDEARAAAERLAQERAGD